MIRKVSKLTDSDVPIDAFDKVDQRILQYDVTREDGKIKVDYHGINELPYQDIHASVKSVNIVSAGGMSRTYFLQLNWLDNKRNIVNQLVSSFPATSDAYARAQWQFIRNYMERMPIAYRPSHPLTHRRRLKNTRFISIQIASYPAMVSLKTLKYGRGISHCWYYKHTSNWVVAGYSLKAVTS